MNRNLTMDPVVNIRPGECIYEPAIDGEEGDTLSLTVPGIETVYFIYTDGQWVEQIRATHVSAA